MKQVTVEELINSLSKYPKDAPVEVAVYCYNQYYPVFYAIPKESAWVGNNYVNMKNGKDVRIEINMPETETHYGTVTMRKKL